MGRALFPSGSSPRLCCFLSHIHDATCISESHGGVSTLRWLALESSLFPVEIILAQYLLLLSR